MRLDGHIHIRRPDAIDGEGFRTALSKAGVDGGVLISLAPPGVEVEALNLSWRERLDNMLRWADLDDNYFGFYWIEPRDDDALEQVRIAAERGATGFKVICHEYFPGNDSAMDVFRAIAAEGKPMLFHSGILWNGRDSARYNRPGEFEALIEIEGLKFTLAHIGWPWCDEMIAVYGKLLNAHARRPDLAVEMFIDNTPGTPEIYRREALTKVFTVGYDIERNFIFGTDCYTHDYNWQWARKWIDLDDSVYDELNLSAQVRRNVYADNLLRLVGSDAAVEHALPRPAV